VKHPLIIDRCSSSPQVAHHTPPPSPEKKARRVDLGDVLSSNCLVIVESVPKRVVLHGDSSYGRNDTVVSIYEYSSIFIKPAGPESSKVGMKTKEGEGEVGSHHLSVPNPTVHTS
jgi:hypothetical protein